LTLELTINGYSATFATVPELRRLLAPYAGEAFREIWIKAADGPALAVLFNGINGFLMYLRENGDAGFTSRNPNYAGAPGTALEFQLVGGQEDQYPTHWVLPEAIVSNAMEYFVEHRDRAPFVQWHDDSV
jgi:hypothetical protein